ncbi:MAG TPA: type II secretion system protein GspC [Myxococcota bacterium]|nr:type II secretion system protein GspC [Myxococcota bacterium]HOH75818.1 type II secretion system protein GspC [Myxococcota bacterium]HPV03429.1 type II secretion system protein GspC [Myxococcota bacterium]
MQDFIRRHFWAVTLAAIAAGSFLTAGLVSETLGVVFLGSQSGGEASSGDSSPDRGLPRPPVKPVSTTALVSAASERNIFNAEPEVFAEGDFEEGDGSGGQSDAGPAISISVKLLGTLVSPNPEWSMATILLNNESKLVRVGVLLNDTVEIAEIHPRYIVLRQGEKYSVVTVWDVDQPKQAVRSDAGSQSALGAAGDPDASGGDPFAAGIRKKGPNDYQIDKNMLEEQLQDLTKLGMQARIVPNYEAGKYAGFRLVGIRPNSLYKAIGLQSGDLLRRINGEEIDTPNKAIQLFEQLRNSNQIAVDVVRRGKKITMNYSIQ